MEPTTFVYSGMELLTNMKAVYPGVPLPEVEPMFKADTAEAEATGDWTKLAEGGILLIFVRTKDGKQEVPVRGFGVDQVNHFYGLRPGTTIRLKARFEKLQDPDNPDDPPTDFYTALPEGKPYFKTYAQPPISQTRH